MATNLRNPRRSSRRRKATPIAAPTRLSYDAVRDAKRRRAPLTNVKSEDKILASGDRKKLVATARDIRRNFAIAGWMIRKHLDFVSSFTFQSRTGDAGLDRAIEELMAWYEAPENCDAAGRHCFSKLMRIAESSATLDGDVFFVKLSNGRLQAIEGDRIRDPQYKKPLDMKAADWTHGIKTTTTGRAVQYCLCNRRDAGGFEFARIVPAKYVIPHGFFERFDQVRGISPLAPAINTLQDCYENWTYALAKAKLAQIFGLIVTRQAAEAMGPITADTANAADGEADDADATEERYSMEVGGGPFKLEMDPGDDAKILSENAPSSQFAAFTESMIASAIKCLDIPYSFYDERAGNYYQSRGALIQYLFSAEQKRQTARLLRDRVTAWRMGLWKLDGLLPDSLDVSKRPWEWIAKGLPWWNPLQETKADALAIDKNLTTRTAVLKTQGRDFREVVDEAFAEEEYIRKKQADLDKKYPPPAPVAAGGTNGASDE